MRIREGKQDSEGVKGSKLVQLTSIFSGPRPGSCKLVRDTGQALMVLPKSLPDLLFLVLSFTSRKSFSSHNSDILWRSLGSAYLVLIHNITAL